jgi:hypothetical protein
MQVDAASDGSYVLTVKSSGKRFWIGRCGCFSSPHSIFVTSCGLQVTCAGRYTQESLAELDRPLQEAAQLPDGDTNSKAFLHATGGHSLGPLRFEEIFGNVSTLHTDPSLALAGSLFQVASQFNVLEMAAPEVSPDAGITCYQHDRTQGPACAMACPAGTVFRSVPPRHITHVTHVTPPPPPLVGIISSLPLAAWALANAPPTGRCRHPLLPSPCLHRAASRCPFRSTACDWPMKSCCACRY